MEDGSWWPPQVAPSSISAVPSSTPRYLQWRTAGGTSFCHAAAENVLHSQWSTSSEISGQVW